MDVDVIYFSFYVDHPGMARRLKYLSDAGYRVGLVGVIRGEAMSVKLDADEAYLIGQRPGMFRKLWARVKASIKLYSLLKRSGSVVLLARALPETLVASLVTLGTGRVSIIYGVHDVHPHQSARNIFGWITRCFEGWVLRRADILALTSPGFRDEFYSKNYAYIPDTFLWENKVAESDARMIHIAADRLGTRSRRYSQGKPRIVYPGTLRCHSSLEVLSRVACIHDRCELHLWGRAKKISASELAQLLVGCNGSCYHGTYAYPDQLFEVYAEMDFCWAIDGVNLSENSSWLLPNRLYEAALFGVPVIALEGSYAGRWVDEHGTGFTIADISESSLIGLFDRVPRDRYHSVVEQIQSLDRSAIVDLQDTRELMRRAQITLEKSES
jgi:succinoglycan biosynthesis protein ExoL